MKRERGQGAKRGKASLRLRSKELQWDRHINNVIFDISHLPGLQLPVSACYRGCYATHKGISCCLIRYAFWNAASKRETMGFKNDNHTDLPRKSMDAFGPSCSRIDPLDLSVALVPIQVPSCWMLFMRVYSWLQWIFSPHLPWIHWWGTPTHRVLQPCVQWQKCREYMYARAFLCLRFGSCTLQSVWSAGLPFLGRSFSQWLRNKC